ncbi:MAG: hypothetical protein AABZ67_12695 [Pseudomonadota bacterium]
MDSKRSGYGIGTAGIGTVLALILSLVHSGIAQASLPQGRSTVAGSAVRAETEFIRFVRATSRVRPAVAAAPKSPPANTLAASPGTGTRADKPVIAATAAGTDQAGYVHYFLLRLPDDTLEIQVGIEMPDQRIAWSFPDLGVVISPFVESGIVPAGGKDYEVWHLYGIRPFPDDAAMATLRGELANRIQPWAKAATPYCENDGPRSSCMSCLGFVLRVLFPGKYSDYPVLPRDFWRAGTASRYTTRDLLLYLTGMLDLQTREARLQRIASLTLPENLREDLEELVYSMGAFETAATADAAAPRNLSQKRPGVRPAKIGVRPIQRRKL